MATPKRKPQTEHLTAPALLGMMAQLATSKFFEIIVYGPDDYEDLEDLFVNQLGRDVAYLNSFKRVMECAILLDSQEYQNLVFNLCGDKNFARQTEQYIQCVQFQEDEICIINLFRRVHKRLKTTSGTKKTARVTKGTPKKAAAPPDSVEQQLAKLNKLMSKALKLEDYRHAAALQKQIDELKSK
jgi:hypothetical protein